MKTAIVTGASAGIGLEISKILAEDGFKVFGISRNFQKCTFESDDFQKIECDITITNELVKTVKEITKVSPQIDLLVNNAGLGVFGQLETISGSDIKKMVDTNLTAPIILTRLLINRLKESNGKIINISSIAATEQKAKGTVYSATKAGLLQFGEALFEEVRKDGVSVTTILPDMTTGTDFYDASDFEPFSSSETAMEPSTVALCVLNILNQPDGTVLTQVRLKPQKFRLNKKNSKKQ
ncbi:MAG: SDR family NAD(P)-dependent oxidoreductase [Deltaproteobacteria bacterium]|nr:SDR family NAD(P)-dependent oxidoreductase [Deltaproteobacteria bacterium]